jgi:hypothetical protein
MYVTTEGLFIVLLSAALVVLAQLVALAVRAVKAFRRLPPPPTALDAESPPARGVAWLVHRPRPWAEKNLSQGRGC